MGLSTHVLDTAAGAPARGVPVFLSVRDGGGDGGWAPLVTSSTDDDGRAVLLPGDVGAGTYQLRFDTSGASAFFPEVSVVFSVGVDGVGGLDAGPRHLHVPLLLSPFGYTTYRGS